MANEFKKYVLILTGLVFIALMIGCTRTPSYPKVGECFEHYFLNAKKDTYELRKVISIDIENRFNEIRYVYNFPNSAKFKKGTWYELYPLTAESRDWFFAVHSEDIKVNKINCPW